MLKGSILQQLEVAHQKSKRQIRFGVYYKNTLVSLCHALEDNILTEGSLPLVITAFQQGKWYLQEADRYGAIAQQTRQVAIMAGSGAGFAEHPTSQLSNVAIVELDSSDPVAQEWHLIILSPTYTAMVLCQELSEADYGPFGPPESDLERKFYGLWTFEPDLVQETVELAIAHIGRYNPELQKKLTAYRKEIQPAWAKPEDLSAVVSRVVDYLQTGQEHLSRLQPSIPIVSRQQALDRNLVSNEIQAFLRMAQLVDEADITNPMATAEVVALAETIGQLLDLPAWQLKRLRLAGLLHRLDPLQGESVLTASASFHYQKEAACCPLTCLLVPGAQVLRTMPQLRAVAQIITHQTEWWNGTGEPAGLSGDEIPVESRVLGLVVEFQQHLARLRHTHSRGEIAQALAECQQQEGDRWDPKLLEVLVLLVKGLQQGLDLPLISPKYSAGMWLLDSYLDNRVKLGEEIDSYRK